MTLVLPRRSLNLDFVRDGQASGDNYPTELSKLDSLLTFARASTATRFNSAGVLETVAADQPRFDFDPVTLACKGLLLEESRTNNCLQSLNFATGWGLNGGITRTAGTDTVIGMDRLIAVNATGSDSYSQGLTGLSTSGPNILSVYVKKYAGTAISQVAVYDGNSAVFIGRFQINWATMAVTALSGATLLTAAVIGTGVERVSISIPAVTAGHALYIYVYPDAGASQSGCLIGGIQVEVGAFATSYIPTTTAAATRALEYCSTTQVAPWFNQAEGTIVFEGFANYSYPSSYPRLYSFSDGTNNNQHHCFANNGLLYSETMIATAAMSSFADAFAVGSAFKKAFGYKLNAFSGAFNGGAVQTDASGVLPTVSVLYLGKDGGGVSPISGVISRFRYMPYKVSDTLLKALST